MKDSELEIKVVRNLQGTKNFDISYKKRVIGNDYNHQKFDLFENYNENDIIANEHKFSNQNDNNNCNDDNNSSNSDFNTNNKNISENAVSPSYYQNNQLNTNKTNLNSLNTKKLGKKVHIQLIKGPQGLGFKLAARDNPTGELSPIYIKNILPKGAAIADGRLQRGDRLLEVNGVDMTSKTLHEAVNILRNTKLGSLVNIVVSRQIHAFPRELVSMRENIYNIVLSIN